MNKYTAQEQAYKNGYELGKKVKQEKYAEQFIKGFNEVVGKQGYWKPTKEPLGVNEVDCVECSVCGKSWIIDKDLSAEELTQYWNYCVCCGAKMNGVRKERENDDR